MSNIYIENPKQENPENLNYYFTSYLIGFHLAFADYLYYYDYDNYTKMSKA